MADKIRAKKAAKDERLIDGQSADETEHVQPATKKTKQDVDAPLQEQIDALTVKALWKWNEQMQAGTDDIYKSLYGNDWEEGKKHELERLAKAQIDYQKYRAEIGRREDRRNGWQKARDSVKIVGVYKDDVDPRY